MKCPWRKVFHLPKGIEYHCNAGVGKSLYFVCTDKDYESCPVRQEWAKLVEELKLRRKAMRNCQGSCNTGYEALKAAGR